jgi:hypothetical protein
MYTHITYQRNDRRAVGYAGASGILGAVISGSIAVAAGQAGGALAVSS